MTLSVTIDPAQLAEVRTLLSDVKNGAVRALARGINRTRDHCQSQVVKSVYDELNLTQTTIREYVPKSANATFTNLTAKVTAMNTKIPLYEFPWSYVGPEFAFVPPRPVMIKGQWVMVGATKRRQVSVKVRRSKSAETWRHIFLLRFASGHVGFYARVGDPRLHIYEQPGPSVAGVVEGQPGLEDYIMTDAGNWLVKEVDSAAMYLLTKQGEPV